MAHFVIIELTETLHGKITSTSKVRIQISLAESKDLDAIEEHFITIGDDKYDVPNQDAVVVNYFQTPEVE